MLELVLIAILAFYVISSLWMYFSQEEKIFRPSKLPSNTDLGIETPHEEKWYEVEPDLWLNAVHLKVDDPKGIIFYHHGNSGNLEEWKDIASDLLHYGYDILVYDYRGYGKSDGKIKREDQLFRDASYIYKEIKKEYTEKDIILYGRSLGSGIAAYLASKYNPGMLLLETPYYSMLDLVFHYHPWLPHFLLLRYPLRTDRFVRNVSCPVHIFHGDEDEVVYYRSSVKLRNLLKQGDTLYTIQGGHHSDLHNFREFHERLSEVLCPGNTFGTSQGKVFKAS